MILILVFGIIFAFLFLGVPIAFCILTGTVVGLWALLGTAALCGIISESVHHLIANYTLAVAPMFILVGTLAEASGLGERAYTAFNKSLGQLRGGLLMATTGAAALFGACSGSSLASAALFSRLALPELKKLDYQTEISLGAIATAGGLATLIPPSIMVVFYGILTNTPIGKVLIAGIVPGVILSLLIIGTIYAMVLLNPAIAPKPKEKATFWEKVLSIFRIWPLLVVFLIIVGGIYTGFCTPTEAGAVGAAVVFLYNLFSGTTLKKVAGAFKEAALLTSQIFILVIGGMLLSKVIVLSGVSRSVLEWLQQADLSMIMVWTIFILIYLVLGALLDPVSMLVLTLPMGFPILTKMGVDPIALGVVVLIMVEAAVITPPIGFNVYVVAAVAEVDPVRAFRGSIVFFFVILFMTVILILMPGIATWLPNLAFK